MAGAVISDGKLLLRGLGSQPQGNPYNKHPIVGGGEESRNPTVPEEDLRMKESCVHLPGWARVQGYRQMKKKSCKRAREGWRREKESIGVTQRPSKGHENGCLLCWSCPNLCGIRRSPSKGPLPSFPLLVRASRMHFLLRFHWAFFLPLSNSIVAISMCHLSFLNISDMQDFIFITIDYVMPDKRTQVLTLKFHSIEPGTKQVLQDICCRNTFIPHRAIAHGFVKDTVKDKGVLHW